MGDNKDWTHAEYLELMTTIKELTMSQEQTTKKIARLTSAVEKLVASNKSLSELTIRVIVLEKRVKNLEETKEDTFSFILKTIGSILIIGAIYAFILFKGK